MSLEIKRNNLAPEKVETSSRPTSTKPKSNNLNNANLANSDSDSATTNTANGDSSEATDKQITNVIDSNANVNDNDNDGNSSGVVGVGKSSRQLTSNQKGSQHLFDLKLIAS